MFNGQAAKGASHSGSQSTWPIQCNTFILLTKRIKNGRECKIISHVIKDEPATTILDIALLALL
jgi:hypothetical protein